eukprot:TRINITY_DN12402_c0_g1_i1.p1 TRINITY_DN12402_c0_g1~~TRINITY_DN12402_c0_g1_i1.p1  ORF type:complete len:595 (-),score=101.48 TRINITY_DN12402_c0_g1_i1:94-1842(-)
MAADVTVDSDAFVDAAEEIEFADNQEKISHIVSYHVANISDERLQIRNLDDCTIIPIDKADSIIPHLPPGWNRDSPSIVEPTPNAISSLSAPPSAASVPKSKSFAKKILAKVSGLVSRNKTPSPDYDPEARQVSVNCEHKLAAQLTDVCLFQRLKVHQSAIWSMKFSRDGRYLATGGEDGILVIHKLADVNDHTQLLMPEPFRVFMGHESGILDITWDQSGHVLTASRDNTVRYWHPDRVSFTTIYQHPNNVTAVAFHPHNDACFATGSIDGRLRLWTKGETREEQCMASKLSKPVTAIAFTLDGRTVMSGHSNGKLKLFRTDNMRPTFEILVRSHAGRNAIGHRITSIVCTADSKSVVVSTADSRIRTYSLVTKKQTAKFTGFQNDQVPIRALLSGHGRYLISGSENGRVYIWDKLQEKTPATRFRGERDECAEWFQASTSPVITASFVPARTPHTVSTMNDTNSLSPLPVQRAISPLPQTFLRDVGVSAAPSGRFTPSSATSGMPRISTADAPPLIATIMRPVNIVLPDATALADAAAMETLDGQWIVCSDYAGCVIVFRSGVLSTAGVFSSTAAGVAED